MLLLPLRFSLSFAPFFSFIFLLGANGGHQSDDQTDVDNPSCSEPRDKGAPCPSEGTVPAKKFYYNQQMGVCQPFVYKGCEGNANRFETAQQCRRKCAKSSGGGGGQQSAWILAERCNGTHLIPDGRYLECSEGKCPEGHRCTATEGSDGVCCPTKEFVCGLQDDSGTFAEGVPDKPRFAWSADIKSCWRFSYFGAKGNYNNFGTFQDCLNFCGEQQSANAKDEKGQKMPDPLRN